MEPNLHDLEVYFRNLELLEVAAFVVGSILLAIVGWFQRLRYNSRMSAEEREQVEGLASG